MRKTFDKKFITANQGCYIGTPGKVEALSFINNPEITIEVMMDSEMPIKDKFWWIRNKCDLDLKQKQSLACVLSKITLPIFEEKYPDDKAPREAIEAAEAYLAGTGSIENLRLKRYASWLSRCKAFNAAAAYAADAAAYAADAYAAAADAYAYAADAYAAAKKPIYKELLLQALIEFIKQQP